MKSAPDAKDVLEFQFKQSYSWKISDGFNSVPPACSLITVDSKRGLIYAACDNKITVLKSGNNSDKEWRKEFVLPAKVTRLSLNCDCSLLAVTFHYPTAYIYNAASVVQQNLELLREIKLSSTDNVHVLDLRWNPCIPGMLCVVTSDYTVESFSITADKSPAVLTILGKLETLDALCVAWSPKGKQLVIGCKSGNLVQLKPDLKVARNISGPNPSIGGVISLLWISNYQFCAAYLDPQDSRINVLIIDAPKGEANTNFTCYEDITYGLPGTEGEESGPRYYFEHISEWGLIVAASSGSSEVAVLGWQDNGIWEQWQLVDSGRAQLPLVRTSESYPVGLSVDRTSVQKLAWGGEGSTLPHPVPILHIFGTSGQLCSFHMVNLMPKVPSICSPPTENIPSSSQTRPSLTPSEISFNLAGRVTSTPRPKQIDTISDCSKASVPTTLFTNTPEVPVVQSPVELNVPKPQIKNIEVAPKVELVLPPTKEVKQQEKIGIDNNICIKVFQEECSLFEKELKSRSEVQIVDIGSATERNELTEKSEKMSHFLTDLQETTASLTSDISYLKALLLQTYAWLEETKSKCSSNSSNHVQTDGENNKLKELRSLMYHTQSRLEQANRALDYEWLEHINKEKSKMKVPSLEYIYQIMLQHLKNIAKEKNIIQVQMKKWKALTRGDITSSLNKSMFNMSLSTSSSVDIKNRAIEQRCKTIANRSCCFSREKQCKLKNLLNQSTIKVIMVATPSLIQDRLEATLSLLVNASPPKGQTQAEKSKSKPEQKIEQVAVTASLPIQPPRSPLASLDQIVANIGAPRGVMVQNTYKAPASNTAIVSASAVKVVQVDPKTRVTATSVTPQTPLMGQSKQTPASLFGTPQTPLKPMAGLPAGTKSMSIYEVSPFTSTASKTLVSSGLPPALLPTGVTTSSLSKPFSKIDNPSFNSTTIKTDTSPIVQVSTETCSPKVTPVAASIPVSQTSPQTNLSLSDSVQPAANQTPNYSTVIKTSFPAVTTTSISVTTSPMQSFSFASKPASSTAFSFASKPANSSPSTMPQSLDLSAMGLELQASSNTSGKNLTPTTTVAGSILFGSTASPPSGSIFAGTSTASKEKSPGSTIFGQAPVSSLFGGTAVNANAKPLFGEGVTTSSVKPSVFGGSPASSSASIFGDSTANSPKSVAAEISVAPVTTSGFQSPINSSSTSVFGNISSNSGTTSVFGGSSVPLSSASTSGATDASSTPFFVGGGTSFIKPSTFAGDSVKPSTSLFGRPLESKPLTFGNTPTSSAPFGTTSTESSNPSMFGGAISNPPTPSIFGGASTNVTNTSVFGTVSPNQSIFGGAASSPTPATNIGVTMPTATPAAPAFGQTATFGAKPGFGFLFGSSNPTFGSGFGNTAFPVASQPTAGFGGFNTATPMGGNTSPIGGSSMQKVFGESSGSSTFENLATQEGGLTFGNLAQKQAEPAAPPAFSGKSSFQSWR